MTLEEPSPGRCTSTTSKASPATASAISRSVSPSVRENPVLAGTWKTRPKGVSSEEAVYLRATRGELSLQGLLLAEMVIGASASSTTSRFSVLHRDGAAAGDANLGFPGLFRGALAVGHDHIAATVNTLVLTYAGASLPVLLIFSLADTSLTEAINFETVAEAIVAMLVGSIGLIAAVPITTALAALLANSTRAPSLAHSEHAH